MGFLMRRGNTLPLLPALALLAASHGLAVLAAGCSLAVFVAGCSLAVLLAGCGHVRFAEPPQDAGWRMYGGDGGRRNVATDSLAPPLIQAWEFDAGAGFGTASLGYVDTTLFVSTLKGEVHALSMLTGKEIESYSFGSAIMGTPVLDSSQMVVALADNEEGLVSYNLREGSRSWKLRTGEIETSPLLAGGRLFVTTIKEGVLCVNRTSGAIEWRYRLPYPEHPPMIHSSPAGDGRNVVFGCDDGKVYAVSAGTGLLQWTAQTGAAILASPSIDGSTVYVSSLDGCMYALNAADGTLRWKRQLGAPVHASQAVDETHVYVGTAGRDFFALDKVNGSVVWKFTANGAISSAPIVSNGTVYVGSIDRNLYALSCATGEQVWKFEAKGRIKSMPVICKRRLFVSVEDTSVLSFSEGPAQ
jgi:outer membrane protein assembly factor BamB